jgi:Glyoxalase/Bleomycin resistance protein/Dioxygenase superfamily
LTVGFGKRAPIAYMGSIFKKGLQVPMNSIKPIGQSVRIGHVHLKVADLERALEFYCGVLGFETTDRFGREAARVLRSMARPITG